MDFLDAVQHEPLETVTYLLNRLQEITSVNLQYSYYIAVKTAVNCQREDVVQLLLEKNCSVNQSDDTPLHIAAKLGNSKIVELLLKKGASIIVANEAGDTALHVAFENKHMEVVDLMLNFIEKSSNYLNLKNKNNLTHLQIACDRGKNVLVEGFLAAASDEIKMIKDHPIYKDLKSTKDLQYKETKQKLQSKEIKQNLQSNEIKQNLQSKEIKQKLQSKEIKQNSVEPSKKSPPASKILKSLEEDLMESSDSDTSKDSSQNNHDFYGQFLQACADRCNAESAPRPASSVSSAESEDSFWESSEFHIVCSERHPDVVRRYIRQGANVNAPLKDLDWNGYPKNSTPLHVAVEESKGDNVKVLMEHGANVMLLDKNRATPLHVALYKDDPMDDGETLNLLYAATKDKSVNLIEKNGMSFLHVAASRNDLETVKMYLDKGENVNQMIGKDEYYGVSYFTPLHFAAQYRHQEMVELLIERGADINSPSIDRPLHVACESGHQGIIELLLEKGARADKKAGVWRDKTPLHLLLGHISDVQWAEVNAGDCKDEQEMFDKDFDRKLQLFDPCFDKLLKAGCDINAKDKDGNTALHYACASRLFYRVTVRKLLWKGADINVENRKGETPMMMRNIEWYNGQADDFMVLYHHVQDLKALGMEVNPKNEECCKKLAEKKVEWSRDEDWELNGQILTNEELAKREKQRLDEVEKMKKVMLTKKVSLYDFVKLKPKTTGVTVKNAKLREVMKEANSRGEYAVYWYRIWLHWNKALKILKDRVLAKRKRMLKEEGVQGSTLCKRACV